MKSKSREEARLKNTPPLNSLNINMGLQMLLPQSRSDHEINTKTKHKHQEISKYLSFFKLDASRET